MLPATNRLPLSTPPPDQSVFHVFSGSCGEINIVQLLWLWLQAMTLGANNAPVLEKRSCFVPTVRV